MYPIAVQGLLPSLRPATPIAVADALRREIAVGKLRPGEPLRQEALAERFSVSRMPIRDALRLLESEGVVTLQPNRGARVASMTLEELREVFHLRRLIEVDLIETAVLRLDAGSLRTIRRVAKEAELSSVTPGWVEGDRRFHEALYLPAQRPRQLALAMGLRSSIENYETIYRELPRRRSAWLEDHRALIRACKDGDPNAAGLCLADHLRKAEELLISQLPSPGGH